MKTQTENKHTPGPWVAEDRELCWDAGEGSPGSHGSQTHLIWSEIQNENVVVAHIVNDGRGHGSVDANAALIAAAPLMLEALGQAAILLKHAWDDPALLHSQLADETAATMTEALEQATGKEL